MGALDDAVREWPVGCRTINEAREAFGLAPVEGGEALLRSLPVSVPATDLQAFHDLPRLRAERVPWPTVNALASRWGWAAEDVPAMLHIARSILESWGDDA